RPALRPLRPVVGDDVAARVDRATHVDEARRRVVRPALLVPAHELDPHRLAARLRQDRGGPGRVEHDVAVAEAPRALDDRDAEGWSGGSWFGGSVVRFGGFWVSLQIVA